MAVTADGVQYARKIANDESPKVAITVFIDVISNLMPAMKPESDFYVFTAGQVLTKWLVFTKPFFEKFGYERKAVMPWAKGSPGLGDLIFRARRSNTFCTSKGARARLLQTRQNGFFTDPQIAPGKLIHPHEKPTSLLVKLIEHSTDKGDLVIDPFGGSGSLVRAAQQVERSAVAIELDKEL